MSSRHIAIDTSHAHVHGGNAFVFSTYTTGIATGSPLWVHITTSATRSCHLSLAAAAGGSVVLSLSEVPTTTTTGWLAPVENLNRFAANVPLTQFRTNPRVTSTGTDIYTVLLPGGSGPHAAGTDGVGFSEVLLKTNSSYLIALANPGSSQPASVRCFFYEPPVGSQLTP